MAAAKTEAPPPSAPSKEAAAPAAAPAEAAPKAAGKGIAAFIPLIAVIVLAPALSWGVVQFVLLPQLKKELALPADAHATAEGEHAAEPEKAEAAEGGKEHGKEGKGKGEAGGATNTYEFTNVVVNLAGTMGTRYLKTTFLVTGADKGLRGQFENNKPKLLDVTLNVLSSLSLSDLEEAGAKNIIREKLIGAYNQALGKRVVEQVYFSDFVVQ
jgi:flagellar protein FliL